jgi:hypothetical protein
MPQITGFILVSVISTLIGILLSYKSCNNEKHISNQCSEQLIYIKSNRVTCYISQHCTWIMHADKPYCRYWTFNRFQHSHLKQSISIPHFSASLGCRKQGSCQILVEQSSWQEEIRKIYKWNTMYQTTFQNNWSFNYECKSFSATCTQ